MPQTFQWKIIVNKKYLFPCKHFLFLVFSPSLLLFCSSLESQEKELPEHITCQISTVWTGVSCTRRSFSTYPKWSGNFSAVNSFQQTLGMAWGIVNFSFEGPLNRILYISWHLGGTQRMKNSKYSASGKAYHSHIQVFSIQWKYHIMWFSEYMATDPETTYCFCYQIQKMVQEKHSSESNSGAAKSLTMLDGLYFFYYTGMGYIFKRWFPNIMTF